MFAVKFPFIFEDHTKGPVSFNIKFYVIEGNLPLLIGWPSLRSMKANLNCEYLNLGLKINAVYHKLLLKNDKNHVYLPFRFRSRSFYSGRNRSRGISKHSPRNYIFAKG